jgi:hypothetical protein
MTPHRHIPDDRFPVDPLEDFSLRSAIDLAGSLDLPKVLGWLLFLASKTQRNINQLLEELRRMATNDASLTQAVTDLINAYDANLAAINAEISNIKAATQPETDPAITDAVSKIEGVVAQLNQASAAAQAAITPPASSGDASSDTAAATNGATTSAGPTS